jgi:hypothetical protein
MAFFHHRSRSTGRREGPLWRLTAAKHQFTVDMRQQQAEPRVDTTGISEHRSSHLFPVNKSGVARPLLFTACSGIIIDKLKNQQYFFRKV